MSQQPSPLQPDRTQEPPRRPPFLAGAVAAFVLFALMVWAVWLFVEQQKLERCLASRRTDYIKVDSAPREGIRVPVR